jgi:sigma-B regulation protein RsbU (phosphoserine phosphatase)
MHAPLTSLFMARLDPASGVVDYCSAGHPPALLLRADGGLELLAEGGMLLGMSGDASFRTGRVELCPDEVLLAYTDGVIESRDGSEEEFGCERLRAHIRGLGADSCTSVLFSILAAVQDFAAPNALTDDTSPVVVRRGAVER